MSELKECPFCKGEADIYTSEGSIPDDECVYWVRCDNCDIEQHGFYIKSEAIDRWNRRVK